ncbi:oligosaccharide flippase family protein [Sulfitobacter sp. JB4-11]|uniref:oligosaccharide flippase family protein n=1 Tax=Sulfitobacter rhodophyticola TaxID=3238304 RepID=UPI003D8149EC
MSHAKTLFSGSGLMARVLRSTSWILMGYGASQALRLASNLILTRLLFPEAFGLMALITVVVVGLTLFSDVGISPSIAQSKRGDDPDFLNTAWTIQVIRGFLLWLVASLLAYPLAAFYGQPDLALYLPIAALSLVVAGFNPTRIETAHRHLLMGRLTGLDLISQVIEIGILIALALWLNSVMALAIGGVIGVTLKLMLTSAFLPGVRNRFRWEGAAARELVTFGKWIFLSTVCHFFASQGDRAVLGKFLTLEMLGIYNIGFFLASFPLLLGLAVTARVMIPVYREGASPARIARLRYVLSVGVIGLLTLAALLGPWVVDLLYDPRYYASGAILVLIALAMIPQAVGLTYDQAALAAGDSRRFFIYSAVRSGLQVSLLLVGVMQFGLIGGIIGLGLAMGLAHLMLIWLARTHRVWDPRHDLIFMAAGCAVTALAVWLHWARLLQLAASSAAGS